jgi:DNA-binding response OmpR family regulator
MRILVVDPDPAVIAQLRADLGAEGHEVTGVQDSDRALTLAKSEHFGLCVLDEALSCLSGHGACRTLLDQLPGPFVLMTSRQGGAANRINCLHCGADDYLPQPFQYEELVARIRAALRRVGRHLAYGDVSLDLDQRRLERHGKFVPLTNREFELMAYFMHHSEETLTRDRLAAEVWGMPFSTGTNLVDVYVAYLRRKLERIGAKPIQTIRGSGYRLGPTD